MEDENDALLACRGMRVLPMTPTGAQWRLRCNAAVLAAVLRVSRPRRGQGSLLIQRARFRRYGASLRPLRTLRFPPQPPVSKALQKLEANPW